VVPFTQPDKPLSRPYCWAYPDMLEVGKLHLFFWDKPKKFYAKILGNIFELGGFLTQHTVDYICDYCAALTQVGKLATYELSRAHFGAWCAVSSPLVLG